MSNDNKAFVMESEEEEEEEEEEFIDYTDPSCGFKKRELKYQKNFICKQIEVMLHCNNPYVRVQVPLRSELSVPLRQQGYTIYKESGDYFLFRPNVDGDEWFRMNRPRAIDHVLIDQ